MGIADLFRPKHRHSDAGVRAEAVSHMGADQRDLIADIARSDKDPSVRRVAIEKLHEPSVLTDLARAESDRHVRELATRRAAEAWLLQAVSAKDAAAAASALDGLAALGDQRALAELAHRAGSAEVRRAAMDRVDDQRALAELARNAPQAEIRTTAVGRITATDVLRSIAIDEERRDVALSAMERIGDADVLEEVASRAKSKAVRTRTRKRLAAMRQPERSAADDAARREHAERVQLLRIVEELSTVHEWVESHQRMVAAEEAWAKLGPGDDASLQARFDSATKRYYQRRERYGREQLRPAAVETEPAAVETEPAAATEPAPEVEAEAEAEADGDGAAEARRAEEALRRAEREARRAREEEAARRREEEQQERAQREAENLARLVRACEELERAIEEAPLKQAERALQQTQRGPRSLGPLPNTDERRDLEARFEEGRRKLIIRVRELREGEEWARWASATKQEELIRKAEALAAAEETEGLGDALKALQTAWKQTGPAPRDKSQELWTRFKAACDQAYEKVRALRAVEDESRAENLAKKEALCAEAEALQESTEWEATAAELKRLQAAWKDIGPVPRKHSKAVWNRFRAACDRFFERRKPHLEASLAELTENLQAKQQLCERAEALAESSDWRDTAAELRELQRQWRDIGPVPRQEMGPLGERFRAACDRFFQRRSEHFEAQKNEKLLEVEALGKEIDALLDAGWDAPPPSELAQRTLAVRGKFRELEGEVDAAALQGVGERVERLTAQMVAEHPAEFKGTELDPEASRRKKEKLVAQAEELVPEEEAAPAPSTPEEMAERLRTALAERALGIGESARDLGEVVEELRLAWQRVGPVPGAEGAALEERFAQACERALARVASRAS